MESVFHKGEPKRPPKDLKAAAWFAVMLGATRHGALYQEPLKPLLLPQWTGTVPGEYVTITDDAPAHDTPAGDTVD